MKYLGGKVKFHHGTKFLPKERGQIWEPEGDEIRPKAVGGRKICPKARGRIWEPDGDEIRPKAVG